MMARLSILAGRWRWPPSSPRELMGTAVRTVDAAPASGLVHMPCNWLHDLIVILPAKDRLSLFQTCRKLSRQTVSSSPSVTLCLHPASEGMMVTRWSSRAARVRLCLLALMLWSMFTFMPWVFTWLKHQLGSVPAVWFCQITVIALILSCTSVCYSAIIQLQTRVCRQRRAACTVHILTLARTHTVHANSSTPLFADHQHATVLELHKSGYGYGIWHQQFPWRGCSSITQLTIDEGFHGLDLFQLTLALEGGALQQLRKLALYPNGSHRPMFLATAMGPLARAFSHKLGPHLTHLATNCIQLLLHLQCFKVLQSIEIGPAALPSGEPPTHKDSVTHILSDVADQLYQHPSLRTVTLRSCYLQDTAHITDARCSWQWLTLDGSHPGLLEPINLANLKTVRFAHGVPPVFERDRQQLARLREARGPEVTCTTDRFCLASLCPETTVLTCSLMGVRTVRLLSSHAHVLPWLSLLWLALPPTACSLELCNVSDISAPEAWQGMPANIHSLLLDGCSAPTKALVSWVRGLPAHVQRVRIKAASTEQLEKWQEAGMCTAAPGHVRLELCA